jgi:hypothetical protein
MPARPARSFWIALGVMLAVMAVTLLPLCGSLFGCGCTMMHGAAHCNIHHAAGPHCPWCAGAGPVVLLNFIVIAAGTAASIWIVQRWRGPGIMVGLVGGVIGYLASASLAGLATALAMGYPIWWGLRI